MSLFRVDTSDIRVRLAAIVTAMSLAVVVAPPLVNAAVAAPSIASDLSDYAPGATVTLTGSNWTAGEPVHIVVDDTSSMSWNLASAPDPTADAAGSFAYVFTLPDYFIATYSATATGLVSGAVATTTFTDLSIGTYDQCSNDLGEGYGPTDTGCRWINGNLNGNNSVYPEGDATVQRLWLTGFVPGTSHTVTLQWGTTKAGKHAYDYLTGWNFSEAYPTDADRCETIDGCLSLSDTTYEIPTDPRAGNFDLAPAVYTMRGGVITDVSAPVLASGTYNGDSETSSTITFTVGGLSDMCETQGQDTCGVALWFGAHVADEGDWGPGTGAGSISGSPYHVALAKVDGAAVGKRDNQMQASAVISDADISIVKTDSPDPVEAGNMLTYTLTVTNNSGATPSNAVVVTDTLDANTTYVSAVPSQGSCTPGSGSFTCALGTINGGASATITVTVTVPFNAPTQIDPSTAPEAGNAGTPSASFTCTTVPHDLCNVSSVTSTTPDNNLTNNGYAQPTNVLPATRDAVDLSVTKTVVPTFTRQYKYKIDKSVVGAASKTVGTTAGTLFGYNVKVEQDGYTDSAFGVQGVITVTNPNTVPVPGASVSDSLTAGNSCTVGSSTAPAGLNPAAFTAPAAAGATPATVTFPYTCSYVGTPPQQESNTVNLGWTRSFTYQLVTYTTPSSSDSDNVAVAFTTPTTEKDTSVTLTDTQYGSINSGNPVLWSSLPRDFPYSKSYSGTAGTCVSFPNIATLTTNTTSTQLSDNASVQLCVRNDLVVTKTAFTDLTRTYKYTILKSVSGAATQTVGTIAGTSFTYLVDLSRGGFDDSDYDVTGVITVANSNDVAVTGVTVTDDILGDAADTCTVTNGTGLTVPANSSITVNYACDFGANVPASLGTQVNKATATWTQFGSTNTASDGAADVVWSTATKTERDTSVTLSDVPYGSLNAGLAVTWVSLSTPLQLSYSIKWTGVAGTCTKYDNTATFTTNNNGVTGSDDASVTLCVRNDLVVTKTADTDVTRTYKYKIDKSVVGAVSQTVGTTAGTLFDYNVKIEQNGVVDSDYDVTGEITVANSNDIAVTGVSITDDILADAGDNCVVTNGTNRSVPANDSITVAYACDFGTNVPASTTSQTNRATATWPAALGSTSTSDTGDATADWTTATLTKVDTSVTLADNPYGVINGGNPIAWTSLPQNYPYSISWTGVAGTCTNYDNTATYTTNNTRATGSDKETVTLCVRNDLVVTKTAFTDLTRTYNWRIAKAVDKTQVSLSSGSALFNYTVTATRVGFADSDYDVTGQITVTNSNDIAVTGVTVTDDILGDAADTCTVTNGTGLTVPANSSITVNYACDFGANVPASTTSQTNRATATWPAALGSTSTSDTGDATADWTTATKDLVDESITVTDDKTNPDPTKLVTLGTMSYLDASPKSFQYSVSIPVAPGCVSYRNTATFTTNDTASTGTAQQTVTVCQTISGGHTMGYWQNKNGQADIRRMGVAVCTYLVAAYPNVLGGYLNCTTTATFQSSVKAIIAAAQASGTGELMFRGQFLATALSVARTSALGSTFVSVPGALLGTSSCITVNDLLAAGNAQYLFLLADKSSLMAVKDAYDRINNNIAQTCSV